MVRDLWTHLYGHNVSNMVQETCMTYAGSPSRLLQYRGNDHSPPHAQQQGRDGRELAPPYHLYLGSKRDQVLEDAYTCRINEPMELVGYGSYRTGDNEVHVLLEPAIASGTPRSACVERVTGTVILFAQLLRNLRNPRLFRHLCSLGDT